LARLANFGFSRASARPTHCPPSKPDRAVAGGNSKPLQQTPGGNFAQFDISLVPDHAANQENGPQCILELQVLGAIPAANLYQPLQLPTTQLRRTPIERARAEGFFTVVVIEIYL